MHIEPYLQRIRREFPDLKFTKVTIPCQGMDHVALILDDRWVFRFPIKKKYQKLFLDEIVLLDELQRRLPLPIPQYCFVARDRSFGGYEMIAGDSLQAKTYRTECSASAKERMQSQMAKFLSALHTIPLPFAEKHHVQRLSPRRELSRRLREYKNYLQKTLTKKEQARVDELFAAGRRHLDDPFRPCLIHCDLYVDHIFIDAKHTKISGIIDFGDRAIFDPAIDFSGFWEYGRTFVHNVYAQYTGPKDPTFLERSWLRHQHGALGWLMATRHKKIGSEKEAYMHFRKIFET